MIGSHNSMSYLPIKGWRKIFKPWIQCQSLDIQSQVICGCQYFDIRLRKNKHGLWRVCHNTAIFKYSLSKLIDTLTEPLFNEHHCRFRIILDVRKKPKNADKYKNEFLELIYTLKNLDINIDSAIVFWEWKDYYKHKKQLIQYEKHSSVCASWYEYLLGTKWFAIKYNSKYIKGYNKRCNTKQSVLLIDYIEYNK